MSGSYKLTSSRMYVVFYGRLHIVSSYGVWVVCSAQGFALLAHKVTGTGQKHTRGQGQDRSTRCFPPFGGSHLVFVFEISFVFIENRFFSHTVYLDCSFISLCRSQSHPISLPLQITPFLPVIRKEQASER